MQDGIDSAATTLQSLGFGWCGFFGLESTVDRLRSKIDYKGELKPQYGEKALAVRPHRQHRLRDLRSDESGAQVSGKFYFV
jgi:hypothetical protein